MCLAQFYSFMPMAAWAAITSRTAWQFPRTVPSDFIRTGTQQETVCLMQARLGGAAPPVLWALTAAIHSAPFPVRLCAQLNNKSQLCATGAAARSGIPSAEGIGSGHHAGQRGLPGPGGALCGHWPLLCARPGLPAAQQAPPPVPAPGRWLRRRRALAHAPSTPCSQMCRLPHIFLSCCAFVGGIEECSRP